MGLDIYFESRKKNFDNEEEYRAAQKRAAEIEALPDEKYKGKRIQKELEKVLDTISRLNPYKELLDLRKVNFLLPFFGYEENCSRLAISRDQVVNLIDTCKEILDSYQSSELDFDAYCKEEWVDVAKEKLPNKGGFFFGSTNYDDDYLERVEYVKNSFTPLLETVDWENEIVEMFCWW